MTASGERWSVLVTGPMPGRDNMAADHVLMARAAELDRWILRLYGWTTPTVSFGRNQSALRLYSPAAIRAAGFDVVRRPTGGRAILHGREITYSVTAPLVHAGSLGDSYARINVVLLAALRTLGVDARLARSATREGAPGIAPCFDHPSAGELVAHSRKLVGSAQWRSQTAILQHGSLLIEDEQALLGSLLVPGVTGAPPPPAATLGSILSQAPSLHEAAAAFGLALGNATEVTELDASILAGDDYEELKAHYSSLDWTWRR
jgi:lipoate-protein ligase A